MAYKHGIYTSEVATSLVPMTSTSGGLVVAFGTAPVHLASDPADANTPVLCHTYKEAVAALGYSDDWEKYTLAEVIKTQFALYNVAPIVLVNVLDTKKHKKDVQNKQMAIVDGVVATTDPVLLKTLEVKLSASHQKLAQDKDYTAAYDDDGRLIVTPIPGGGVPSGTTELCLSYTLLDPEAVKPADIIGGINTTTNRTEGLELIDEVFPRFGLVPGIIIAPSWSHDAGVAAVMKAKEHNICGHFNAISICDIPTDEVKAYTGASKWKNEKNFADKDCILCWPMAKLGKEKYHISAQFAALMNRTDSQHDDIPYYPPSNKSLQADGACLADGTEVYLSPAQAAYLNGQGIVTALNFIGGWKSFGNRTTAYPSNTDVKDNFINNRRMFNWVGNTLVTTF